MQQVQVFELAAEVNLGDVIRRLLLPYLCPHTGQAKSSVNTGMVIMRRTVAIALAPRIPCSLASSHSLIQLISRERAARFSREDMWSRSAVQPIKYMRMRIIEKMASQLN